MALITCSECKKDVSEAAATCPHCGYPLAARREQERTGAADAATCELRELEASHAAHEATRKAAAKQSRHLDTARSNCNAILGLLIIALSVGTIRMLTGVFVVKLGEPPVRPEWNALVPWLNSLPSLFIGAAFIYVLIWFRLRPDAVRKLPAKYRVRARIGGLGLVAIELVELAALGGWAPPAVPQSVFTSQPVVQQSMPTFRHPPRPTSWRDSAQQPSGAEQRRVAKEWEFVELCGRGTPEQVTAMIVQGADVNAKCGFGPLMWALGNNPNPEVITVLVKAGADVNAKDAYGQTPLMRAAPWLSQPKAIAVLVKAGADVNAKDTNGQTPLISWVRQSSQPAAIALFQTGANGHAPLPWPMGDNLIPDVIAVLVKAGADVNAKDNHGDAPLMWGAREDSPSQVIAALVTAGADVNARDSDGKTPLDIAREHGNWRAVTVLTLAKNPSK